MRSKAATPTVPPPLTENTLVNFEGEPIRFGDLCVQDRKLVQWSPSRKRYAAEWPY